MEPRQPQPAAPLPQGHVDLWLKPWAPRQDSREVLHHVLTFYLGPAHPPLVQTRWGKPELPAPCPLRFNLSHTDRWLAIAITFDMAIGVDLEAPILDPAIQATIVGYLTDAEHDTLARLSSDARPTYLAACWTLREAWLKAQGIGFGAPQAERLLANPVFVPTWPLTPGRTAQGDWSWQTEPLADGTLVTVAIAGALRALRQIPF